MTLNLFALAVLGRFFGHCGYNISDSNRATNFVACARDDVKCGVLHCAHDAEQVQVQLPSFIMSTNSVEEDGKEKPCYTANFDTGKKQASHSQTNA